VNKVKKELLQSMHWLRHNFALCIFKDTTLYCMLWQEGKTLYFDSGMICDTVLVYLGQLTASSSRFIWHKAHGPQNADITQSLQMEPRIPSIRRILVRSATIPPGTKQGTQKFSPTLWAIKPEQQSPQNTTPKQLGTSSEHPHSLACHSLLPVDTWMVPGPLDEEAGSLVTTVVVVWAIVGKNRSQFIKLLDGITVTQETLRI